MTANLLTLNSSETEFLRIGLKNQFAKMHNSSLNTSHSALILGFIFDEHLTFSDQTTSFLSRFDVKTQEFKKIDVLHLVSGINCRSLFVNLTLAPVALVPTHLLGFCF